MKVVYFPDLDTETRQVASFTKRLCDLPSCFVVKTEVFSGCECLSVLDMDETDESVGKVEEFVQTSRAERDSQVQLVIAGSERRWWNTVHQLMGDSDRMFV
jgi:hypothetical protein